MKRALLLAGVAVLLALVWGCPRRNFGSYCGNAVCEVGENAATCPGDCSAGMWSCDPAYYGGNDGCDCGCTSPDPDCGGLGCTAPGCQSLECDNCFGGVGAGSIPCEPSVCGNGVCEPGENLSCSADCGPIGWYCPDLYYDANDGCDCGCGIPDPDCGGLGCTLPGCTDPNCDYCYDGSGNSVSCMGTPPPPPPTCGFNNCADLSGTYVCDNGTCVCASGCQPFGSSVCCGGSSCAGDCIGNPCC